jgi:uncharacterized membrane protein YobD (UPF0266 family)
MSAVHAATGQPTVTVPVAWLVTMARRKTPPSAVAVEVVPGLVLVLVCVYNPATNEGDMNSDWLLETLIVLAMIVAKLSAVTGTAAPVKIS